MRALTLFQPWATLVAEGIKRVETRSWSTAYRGPLAIHAALRTPEVWSVPGVGWVPELERRLARRRYLWLDEMPGVEGECLACRPDPKAPIIGWRPNGKGHAPIEHTITLPLGAVVATCRLVDVLPIWTAIGTGGLFSIPPEPPYVKVWGDGVVGVVRDEHEAADFWIDRQRPLGDFTPGRFAWLLEDIRPLSDPVPAAGSRRLWQWTP